MCLISALLAPGRGLAAGPHTGLGALCRQSLFRAIGPGPGGSRKLRGHLSAPWCPRSIRDNQSGFLLAFDPDRLIPRLAAVGASRCFNTPLQPQYRTLVPSGLGVLTECILAK